jgi:hypothetical protein
LYIANEVRFVAVVALEDLDRTLAIRRSNHQAATAIGKVVSSTTPAVILNSKLGTTRWLDLLSGEQLPEFVKLGVGDYLTVGYANDRFVNLDRLPDRDETAIWGCPR